MGLPPKSSSGPSPHRSLCAFVDGFSLHAATFVPTHDRAALERLLRYILRPAIAAERVSLREDGRVEARVRDQGISVAQSCRGGSSWASTGSTQHTHVHTTSERFDQSAE